MRAWAAIFRSRWSARCRRWCFSPAALRNSPSAARSSASSRTISSAGVAVLQLLGVIWMTYATGWPLLVALAVAIASVYAQVTVNDIVLARYTPPAWRGRIYALRFFIIFTSAGPAVWGIGKLYDRGGFDLVLLITAIVAGIYTANSLMITFAGRRRRRPAHARARRSRRNSAALPGKDPPQGARPRRRCAARDDFRDPLPVALFRIALEAQQAQPLVRMCTSAVSSSSSSRAFAVLRCLL